MRAFGWSRARLIILIVWAIVMTGFTVLLFSLWALSAGRSVLAAGDAASLRYAVLVDAGSSGSRVHVFTYRPASDGQHYPDVVLPSLEKKVTPGLSFYAPTGTGAGESLQPLLRFAKEKVPEAQWRSTPVYLFATAGLRMLPTTHAQPIMESVRSALAGSGFRFQPSWARILSGDKEGLFAWVGYNYAAGTLQTLAARLRGGGGGSAEASAPDLKSFPPPLGGTWGVLELGGASMQITYLPKAPAELDDQYSSHLPLPGLSKRAALYTHSFLGFGADVAFRNASGLKDASGSNPCLPKGYRHTAGLTGSGNFTACAKLLAGLLPRVECSHAQCSIGGEYLPPLTGFFLATENFYYTAMRLGMKHGVNASSGAAPAGHKGKGGGGGRHRARHAPPPLAAASSPSPASGEGGGAPSGQQDAEQQQQQKGAGKQGGEQVGGDDEGPGGGDGDGDGDGDGEGGEDGEDGEGGGTRRKLAGSTRAGVRASQVMAVRARARQGGRRRQQRLGPGGGVNAAAGEAGVLGSRGGKKKLARGGHAGAQQRVAARALLAEGTGNSTTGGGGGGVGAGADQGGVHAASVVELVHAGTRFCSRPWSELQVDLVDKRGVPKEYAIKTCFSSAYAYVLLHHGFHLTDADRQLVFSNTVQALPDGAPREVNWVLGALIVQVVNGGGRGGGGGGGRVQDAAANSGPNRVALAAAGVVLCVGVLAATAWAFGAFGRKGGDGEGGGARDVEAGSGEERAGLVQAAAAAGTAAAPAAAGVPAGKQEGAQASGGAGLTAAVKAWWSGGYMAVNSQQEGGGGAAGGGRSGANMATQLAQR